MDLEAQIENDRKIGGLLDDIVNLERKNRIWIRLLAVMFVFNIGLSVLLGIGFIQGHNTAYKASTAVVNCKASNQSRIIQTRLWEYILAIPSQSPQTDAQRAQVATFRSFLADAFKPIDCSKI